ncbi:hypothetical protein MuYL_1580 [Mucilaginibacter xinganensis]|uniref:Uncharacterized protein n=2 Tax=Mucilaginibacter xinganensis TaxID=1234841 RepID=A0A223NV25_9SPHI|nr:hypothetical protein MuYL_1580 [Mucilaginibacter xinganensis]
MVMLGVNFNEFNIPYPVFIFLLIVCAMISVLSYAGYIYWKIRDWNKYIYNVIYNLMAFFLLGLLVSVIVGFTFLVILNKD